MNATKVDARLASQIALRKEQALRHSARVNWSLAALAAAGIFVGVITWFSQQPRDRDDLHGGLAMGLALATFVVGGLLFRLLLRRPSAKCPQCGCDWNEKTGNDLHQWLAWDHCPGCGIKMNGAASSQASPSSQP